MKICNVRYISLHPVVKSAYMIETVESTELSLQISMQPYRHIANESSGESFNAVMAHKLTLSI